MTETQVMDRAEPGERAPARRGRAKEWLKRYLPAEAAAIIGAVSAAWLVDKVHFAAATAFAGAIGETVAFYAVVVARDWRRPVRPMLRGLLIEFGVAESADTFLVRPLAMYLASALVGRTVLGVILGKLAADVIFYGLAITGYELNRKVTRTHAATADPLAAAAIDRQPWPTPYLLMDLDGWRGRTGRCWTRWRRRAALRDQVQPDNRRADPAARARQPLRDRLGTELRRCCAIGVDPARADLQQPGQAGRAHRQGVRGGRTALRLRRRSTKWRKLAAVAPDASVFVRLAAHADASDVPSEGKFGVDADAAVGLLAGGRDHGLDPFGITFHVGSQMLSPIAWATAVQAVGQVTGEARRRAGSDCAWSTSAAASRPGTARSRCRLTE